MTREERKKAINALKVSVPMYATTQEEFINYRQTLNKIMDWLEQEPILDKIFCIVHPLSIMSTPELEHKAIMQIAEMLEPLCLAESEDKE